DQALDFLRAPVNFSLGDVALFALLGGVGEHGIFRGDPATGEVLFLHPSRDGLLHCDAADDARVAPFNQGRTGGVRGDLILKSDRAQLARAPAIGADRGRVDVDSGLRWWEVYVDRWE